jgi:hypothetical protein
VNVNIYDVGLDHIISSVKEKIVLFIENSLLIFFFDSYIRTPL